MSAGVARAAALGAVAAAATGYAVWQGRHRARWVSLLNNRIPAHHEYWKERGRLRDGAVLYVALGDSAALGLGASTPPHGYVGLLADVIGRVTGRPVRVRNLSIDGARVRTVIDEELPRMPTSPDVVTVAVGGNDVWTFDAARFAREFDELLGRLPPGTIVGEVPTMSPIPVGGRVRDANRIIRETAAKHGMPVAPVAATTARGGIVVAIQNAAGDLFHPNDRGHRSWADAFAPAVRDAARRVIATA